MNTVKNDVPCSFGNAYNCLTCKHIGDDLKDEPCRTGITQLPDCKGWEPVE
jgi:hypothetical protein